MTAQKIFFSYSRVDGSEFALRLALDLKRKGFDVWIDQEDIRAGSEWDIEIEKALETCDCLLFVETEKSVISNNVLDEVYYALEQNKKVIPLILVDSKTPFRLKRLQHIDFTTNYDHGLHHLINELEGSTSAQTYQPQTSTTVTKVNKPFYEKYPRLIMVIAAVIIIVTAALIYTAKNDNALPPEINQVVNTHDTVINDHKVIDTTSTTAVTNGASEVAPIIDKKGKTSNKKNLSKPSNVIANKTNTEIEISNKTFAGDWGLVNVEPKAETTRGYLKIEAIDETKVTIKSYMQFYYTKTNATSYLSVFNAFAGCTTCVLEKNMKIVSEDVSIGSRTIKTLKEDQPDGGKAGDVIMDASANKSVRATVTLHLIDNTTAIIKVQRTEGIELAHGLMLEPFAYSFRFKKSE